MSDREAGMEDPRKLLVGTWKSDKRRTLSTCHRYYRMEGPRKRKFASLFGRLVLRYTGSRVFFSLGDTSWTARYDVVASDSEGLVLRIHSDDLWKKAVPLTADIVKQMSAPRLQHIQFSGRDLYWIGCGSFCEWFQRQAAERAGNREVIR